MNAQEKALLWYLDASGHAPDYRVLKELERLGFLRELPRPGPQGCTYNAAFVLSPKGRKAAHALRSTSRAYYY